ncbi:hypothetical protein LCGC14_3002960, partial [marine sediment metagenome]
PREWEVLELVREGLTNEQIAERLGISRDGVKYHVSEILSKLGLSSRQEAAAWQPERRPWWAVAPAFLGWTLKQLSLPTAAKVAGGVAVVAVAGGVGVLVWAVVATGGPAGEDRELTPADLSDLTLEEAYARIEEAITRPGFVLHSTIEAMGPDDAGEMTPYYTKEFWIDADLRTLREEFRLDPGRDSYDIAEEGLAIVAGDYIYLPDDPGEALRFEVEHFCPGSRDAILSRLLECGESQVSGPLPELLEAAHQTVRLQHPGVRADCRRGLPGLRDGCPRRLVCPPLLSQAQARMLSLARRPRRVALPWGGVLYWY